jgi:hypothetical protein
MLRRSHPQAQLAYDSVRHLNDAQQIEQRLFEPRLFATLPADSPQTGLPSVQAGCPPATTLSIPPRPLSCPSLTSPVTMR